MLAAIGGAVGLPVGQRGTALTGSLHLIFYLFCSSIRVKSLHPWFSNGTCHWLDVYCICLCCFRDVLFIHVIYAHVCTYRRVFIDSL
jgi:hypothetical protein